MPKTRASDVASRLRKAALEKKAHEGKATKKELSEILDLVDREADARFHGKTKR